MSTPYPGPENRRNILAALASVPTAPEAPYLGTSPSPGLRQVGPMQAQPLHYETIDILLSTDGGSSYSVAQGNINPSSPYNLTLNSGDKVKYSATNANGTTEGAESTEA